MSVMEGITNNLSPNQLNPGGEDYINKLTPPMLFESKELHKATEKGYQGKPFAVSNLP